VAVATLPQPFVHHGRISERQLAEAVLLAVANLAFVRGTLRGPSVRARSLNFGMLKDAHIPVGNGRCECVVRKRNRDQRSERASLEAESFLYHGNKLRNHPRSVVTPRARNRILSSSFKADSTAPVCSRLAWIRERKSDLLDAVDPFVRPLSVELAVEELALVLVSTLHPRCAIALQNAARGSEWGGRLAVGALVCGKDCQPSDCRRLFLRA
jgi:hypothetical protein